MTTHADHRFSVTIHTDDLNNNIPWGGTKDADWQRHGHRVTFRFSSSEFRDGFLSELKPLLPPDLWQEQDRSDSDPAIPQK